MVVKVSKPELNLREKISELDKPSGIAGEAMLRAETPQEQFNLINAGRRNLLINGDFQVSQRGDYTTAASANVSYFVDRWYTDVASPVSVNRQHITGIDISGTPSISKGVRLVATSSGTSYTGVRQKIENPTQYVGRTFTYSGWVRSNTPNARLTSYGSGSPNQIIVSEPHSGGGEWEKLSVTFTLNSDVSTNWYVSAFISTSGIGSVAQVTGDYIEVTQLQLELGKVATPFEHRFYGEELALCQRYYQKLFDTNIGTYRHRWQGRIGSVYSTTRVFVTVDLPVQMRATPTLVFETAGNGFRWNIYSANADIGPSTAIATTYPSRDSIGFDVTPKANLPSGYVGFACHMDVRDGWCHANAEI
jgi:hypothetical protein